ncbi:MAG: peptide-methionine (S)-S-oxide reductase MsrA [archaeon]|jgi:peptide-methionine (S)-S-oxide reductase
MFEKATFGAGCFWHVEKKFSGANGVIQTRVGYMGGKTEDPTYEDVCADKTGHIEVVEVTFDKARIKYEELLDLFWRIHDPTKLDEQGADKGTQYRSIIFYHSEDQKKKAFLSKERLIKNKKCGAPIVTEIRKAGKFWKAEDYHQKYLMKKGKNTC